MKNKKIRYTLLILAAVIFVVILVIILTFKGTAFVSAFSLYAAKR